MIKLKVLDKSRSNPQDEEIGQLILEETCPDCKGYGCDDCDHSGVSVTEAGADILRFIKQRLFDNAD